MDVDRWWPPFVEMVAVVWILLFAVDVAVSFDVLAVSTSLVGAIRGVLQVMFVVFLLDVVLLYRWSDDGPRGFVRSNWFLILTVVPWLRPFRLLRVGRSVRALRLFTGSRRVGSFLNKARWKCQSLWHRLRG
jgi:voltage-gated potassium channel